MAGQHFCGFSPLLVSDPQIDLHEHLTRQMATKDNLIQDIIKEKSTIEGDKFIAIKEWGTPLNKITFFFFFEKNDQYSLIITCKQLELKAEKMSKEFSEEKKKIEQENSRLAEDLKKFQHFQESKLLILAENERLKKEVCKKIAVQYLIAIPRKYKK